MEPGSKKYLDAGEIVNTHGVRGEVKIVPWADSAAFLRGFRTFYIDGRAYTVLRSAVHKGCLLAALEGVPDLDAAAALKGKTVQIDRAEAQLPAGRYFISDLIGARVVTEDGEEIGMLADVIENPTQRVYVVRGPAGEHLIPAVPAFIRAVDPERGVMTVHLIEGM